MAASKEAVQAASWVINMDNGPERSRLYNGHTTRRRDIMENSYRATDHSEADVWLIEQWTAAGAPNAG